MDQKLTLPDFLKLLTSNGVPVAKAMDVASKVFKDYNTPALLAQLDDSKLLVLGIKDKNLCKPVLAAVRKAGYTRPARTPNSKRDDPLQPASASTTLTLKKRKHDESELIAPLDEGSAYGNMDFNDVLDEQVLRAKSTVVNRAPLMTAWAMVVAERLGFEREEALSIGSAYTEINAVSKGVSLGIIDQSRKKETESISGEQPYVDLMGRRPLYQTQLCKWRAFVNGAPALPSSAFSYISRAFCQTTPFVVGALRLLAESWPPQELNKVGFSLYADFRPTVDGWGKKGEVRCERILSLRRGQGPAETHASTLQHDGQHEPVAKQSQGSSRKKVRVSPPDDGDLGLEEENLFPQMTLDKE